MNTLVCRLSSRFAHRYGTLQLSVLMLLAFLQRTPVARVLAAVESAWVSSSLGQVLKATAVVASTLGAVDTLAGATVLATTPAATAQNPAIATTGTAFSMAFSVTGAPGGKVPGSYDISGLPPGLTVTGATFNASTGTFRLNSSVGSVTGTPTTAGEFTPLFTAYEFANANLGQPTGHAFDAFKFITVNSGGPVAPAITTQPLSLTRTAGQAASFSVTASGSPTPTYQWQKNTVAISGATSSTFSIGTTTSGDAGNYRVVVTNSAGSVTSNSATLTINTVPTISAHPASQSVNTGQPVTFSVTASGSPAPSYQWRKGGVNIGGATSSSFTINSVVTGDAGSFSVVVSNVAGSAISNNASLTVTTVTSPVFTTQPSGKTAVTGGSVTFTVAASGTPTPTYQWRKGGANISGATNATLTLTNVQSGDAATYTAVATNSQGSSTSSGAVLTVIAARPGTFDAQGYLNSNPDVAAAIGNVSDKLDQAWIHYLQSGVSENRTDGEFNVVAYLAQYPAVQTQFGSDLAGAAQYWYTTGRALGHRIPSGFDIQGYFARNNDVAGVFANDLYGAWLHFLNFGINEGRQYDSQFIVEEYLLLNIDLTNSFGTDKQAALLHWLVYGKPLEDRIGRVPIGFNVDSYLARYPDLSAAFNGITPRAVRNVTVWHHYLDYGVLEGRSDGDFEAYGYLAENSDLATIFGNNVHDAALHWYFYGRREGRRIPANFDVAGYRTRNPDIVVVWGNDLYGSWLHYRDVGVYEGRVYDDLFRVLEYRARYPDVQTTFGNNLTGVLNHWLFFGKPEGRLGRNP